MIAPPPPPLPLSTPVLASAAASSDAAALAAARRRWARARIKSYTYTAQPAGAQVQLRAAKVVVRGGKVTVTPKDKAYDDLKTVPRLFSLIAKQIATKPYALDVRYARRTGVPTSFSVDQDKLAVDDVWGFTVTGFRAL